jgi:hypothetical protein
MIEKYGLYISGLLSCYHNANFSIIFKLTKRDPDAGSGLLYDWKSISTSDKPTRTLSLTNNRERDACLRYDGDNGNTPRAPVDLGKYVNSLYPESDNVTTEQQVKALAGDTPAGGNIFAVSTRRKPKHAKAKQVTTTPKAEIPLADGATGVFMHMEAVNEMLQERIGTRAQWNVTHLLTNVPVHDTSALTVDTWAPDGVSEAAWESGTYLAIHKGDTRAGEISSNITNMLDYAAKRPSDFQHVLIVPDHRNAPWRGELKYFENIGEFPAGASLYAGEIPLTCRHIVLYKDANTATSIDPYLDLHLHLGHCGLVALNAALTNGTILPKKFKCIKGKPLSAGTKLRCAACLRAKSHKVPDPPRRTEPRPGVPGRHWMLDIKQIAEPSHTDGWRYILGFVDVGDSGHVELYFTETRADALGIVEVFVEKLANGTLFPGLAAADEDSLVFSSDNASEFLSNDMKLLSEKHSFFWTTGAPYKHTAMYAIEATWARLEALARAMHITRPELPLSLWPDMWATAAQVSNCTAHMHAGKIREPPAVLAAAGQTGALDLQHSFRWGDLAIMHTPVEKRDSKMEPRGTLVNVIGWDPERHVYRCYDPTEGTIVRSGHVTFGDGDIADGAVTSRAMSNVLFQADEDHFLSPLKPLPHLYEGDDLNPKNIVSLSTCCEYETGESIGVVCLSVEGQDEKVNVRARDLYTSVKREHMHKTHHMLHEALRKLSPNEHYPLFSLCTVTISARDVQTKKMIRVEYEGIIVSHDPNDKRTGYGMLTFEFDENGHLLIADPHDTHEKHISLFKNKFASLYSAQADGEPLPTTTGHLPETPRNASHAAKLPEAAEWEKAKMEECHGMFNVRRSITPCHYKDLTPEQQRNLTRMTWVFRLKTTAQGIISRFKARLCARGDTQVYGVSYNHTHAPVVQRTTMQTVVNMTVQIGLEPRHFDAEQAFLNTVMPEPIAVKLPDPVDGYDYGLCTGGVYGFKQAGRLWSELSHRNIMRAEPRLIRSLADPCHYYLFTEDLTVLMCTNVDDYFVSSSSKEWLDSFAERYSSGGTKLVDEGVPERWFGINFTWTRDSDGRVDSVAMDQSHDILKTVADFGLLDAGIADTPMDTGFDSTPIPAEGYEPIKFPYASAIGSLLWYGRMTRPDILVANTLLAAHTARPGERHAKAAKRVLKYLKGTAEKKLIFHRNPQFDRNSVKFSVLVDADWAADKVSRRSLVGYITVIEGNATTFKAKHHPTPCLSTLEAEYVAMVYGAKEALFIHYLFDEWAPTDARPGLALEHPIPFFSDSAGAISFAENEVSNEATKHIDLRHFFLRHYVRSEVININKIDTHDNVSDLFTKPLAFDKFKKFRDYILSTTSVNAMMTLISSVTKLNMVRHRKL